MCVIWVDQERAVGVVVLETGHTSIVLIGFRLSLTVTSWGGRSLKKTRLGAVRRKAFLVSVETS